MRYERANISGETIYELIDEINEFYFDYKLIQVIYDKDLDVYIAILEKEE